MPSPPSPLRFQSYSPLWALMTAGPLLFFSGVLLYLGIWIGSVGWIVFSSVAVTTCLALVLLRMPVRVHMDTRTVWQAWSFGPLPVVRKERSLEGYEFIKLGPFSQRGGMMSRSIWRLLEPRYRVSLFGEEGTIPLAAFYKESSARAAATRAASALGLDVYDLLVDEAF
jgi:hypothetical protein